MKKTLTLTAIGTVMLFAANANAAGFLLREQSPSAMGNAFAGATAGAEDISYSFYNPAGLSRHKGTKLAVGASAILPNAKGKDAVGSFGTNNKMDHVVDKAILPSTYMSYQIDDQWTAGIAINSPFGLITDYSDNWAGANHGTLSDVMTVTMTPMLSYRVNDKFSLGAGPQIQYITAKLQTNAASAGMAKLAGDTTDIGYVVGGLYEFNDDTRIGVSYRSQIKHKLKGDIDFTRANPMDQDISARLTTPALLSMGIYHDINSKWAVMAEAQKTYWSSFEKLDIMGDKTGLITHTPENWKDVWFYSIGASYKIDDQWKLRGGLAFDQTPTNDANRTPRIPDSDRIWYSGGVEYKLDEKWTFNAGYTYIRGEGESVNLDAGKPTALTAKYQADIHLVGLSAMYNF